MKKHNTPTHGLFGYLMRDGTVCVLARGKSDPKMFELLVPMMRKVYLEVDPLWALSCLSDKKLKEVAAFGNAGRWMKDFRRTFPKRAQALKGK